MDQIRAYRETLFSREHQQTVLKPLIDQMQSTIDGLRRAERCGTRSIRSASNCGSPSRPPTSSPACRNPTNPVYILKHDTSDCLHASNTESIPPGAPAPANFEVYHQQLFDNNHPTDLWVLNDLGSGKSLTNQAFNRNLHASGTRGHTCGAQAISIRARPVTAIMLRSSRSRPYRCRSTTPPTRRAGSRSPAISTSSAFGPPRWRSSEHDLTPGGRPRVHQELPGSNLYFY